jgi:hypothetical protein
MKKSILTKNLSMIEQLLFDQLLVLFGPAKAGSKDIAPKRTKKR